MIEVSSIRGWKCECTRSHIRRSFRSFPLYTQRRLSSRSTDIISTTKRTVLLVSVSGDVSEMLPKFSPSSPFDKKNQGFPQNDIVLIGLAVFAVCCRGVATLTMTNSSRTPSGILEIRKRKLKTKEILEGFYVCRVTTTFFLILRSDRPYSTLFCTSARG